MQWLIDLIIEAIGIPPVYITRPDPIANDFLTGDFTQDGNWHDLDFSPIVPVGASAVNIQLRVSNTNVIQTIDMRPKGSTTTMGLTVIQNQVANQYETAVVVVSVDADRKLQYKVPGNPFSTITLKTRGWWL